MLTEQGSLDEHMTPVIYNTVIHNLDTHGMAKHTWVWETHALNILTLNAVHHLGLIVAWLIVTVYTQCCLIIRRDVCIHFLNVGSEVFTTRGAFCLIC